MVNHGTRGRFLHRPPCPEVRGATGRDVQREWGRTGRAGSVGRRNGTDYILNDHYQQIATVEPGAGYSFDGHEFWITPQGTAWITATQTGTANLTSIGGAADQTVTNGIAQEIDIKTGKVLFTWNSADHASYADSHAPLPASASQAWDWFHINAVSPGPNGTILINSRHTWSTYDVNSQDRPRELGARRYRKHLHPARRAGPDAEQLRRPVRLGARPAVRR